MWGSGRPTGRQTTADSRHVSAALIERPPGLIQTNWAPIGSPPPSHSPRDNEDESEHVWPAAPLINYLIILLSFHPRSSERPVLGLVLPGAAFGPRTNHDSCLVTDFRRAHPSPNRHVRSPLVGGERLREIFLGSGGGKHSFKVLICPIPESIRLLLFRYSRPSSQGL